MQNLNYQIIEVNNSYIIEINIFINDEQTLNFNDIKQKYHLNTTETIEKSQNKERTTISITNLKTDCYNDYVPYLYLWHIISHYKQTENKKNIIYTHILSYDHIIDKSYLTLDIPLTKIIEKDIDALPIIDERAKYLIYKKMMKNIKDNKKVNCIIETVITNASIKTHKFIIQNIISCLILNFPILGIEVHETKIKQTKHIKDGIIIKFNVKSPQENCFEDSYAIKIIPIINFIIYNCLNIW